MVPYNHAQTSLHAKQSTYHRHTYLFYGKLTNATSNKANIKYILKYANTRNKRDTDAFKYRMKASLRLLNKLKNKGKKK